MNNVIRLPRKPKQQSLKGIGRELVTESFRELDEPCAVVLVVLSRNGSFAFKVASDNHFQPFDVNSRVIQVLQEDNRGLFEFD